VALNRFHRQFVELRALGRGSFGKVFLCRNRDDGCFYAVKKVRASPSPQSAPSLTMKEGLVLSALQRNGALSRNLILYHSMWTEEGLFYLVTDYADGGSLSSLYQRSPQQLEEDDFCRIVENVANGLAAIHSLHFVHFDVKPENILISKLGTYKLADFGLCQKIQTDAAANGHGNGNGLGIDRAADVNEGDARYLCRELIEGTFNVLQLDKVDIFALGVSVYEMINRAPLPTNGFKWQQIRNGNLEWNRFPEKPETSSNMKQLLGAMMHSNPAERPSAKQLTRFLRRFTDEVLQEKDNQIEALNRKIYTLQRQIQSMQRG